MMRVMTQEEALACVVAARDNAATAADDADYDLRVAVRHARDAGATWEEIGDALGVTKQAAFQRFGKVSA